MSDRQQLASPNYAAAVLAWLVPGAGHIYLGQTRRGLFFFGCLVPLYLFGVYLGCRAPVNAGRIKTAGNSLPPVSIVSPLSHPVYFTVQACAGLPTLTVTAINRMARVDSPTVVTDLGVILTSAVGALNFILVIYVLCGAAKDG